MSGRVRLRVRVCVCACVRACVCVCVGVFRARARATREQGRRNEQSAMEWVFLLACCGRRGPNALSGPHFVFDEMEMDSN